MKRRQIQRQHIDHRTAEQSARCQVVAACQAIATRGVPMIWVTRHLAISERTVRRWRLTEDVSLTTRCGRPPQCASREDRNVVYRFLKERTAQARRWSLCGQRSRSYVASMYMNYCVDSDAWRGDGPNVISVGWSGAARVLSGPPISKNGVSRWKDAMAGSCRSRI